jgi:hypothetical protein
MKRKTGSADDEPEATEEPEAVEEPRKKPQEYVTLTAIDHSADHRIYPAGAVVRLDHLAPAQIKKLIDRGHVRPVGYDGG